MEKQKLIGPYQILKPLGEGGMGIVYHACHTKTAKEVALKTIKISKEGLLRSIRREISALASLEHPGIVRIIDQGVSEEGLPWYAMDLLTGHNLRIWRQNLLAVDKRILSSSQEGKTPTLSLWDPLLKNTEEIKTTTLRTFDTEQFHESQTLIGSPLQASFFPRYLFAPITLEQLPKVLTVFSHLCQALAYLHGQGIIHRDLKPENILIRSDGSPVLMDFGIASLSRTQGESSRERLAYEVGIKGTAFYMSPEQIQGQSLDARTDLYSLGVILFELLCGQRPFWKATLQEVFFAHLSHSPPHPSRFVPRLPKELDRLVLALLAKKKQKRPGYAEDIARELQLLVGIEAKKSSAPLARPYLYRPRFVGREALVDRLQMWLVQKKGGMILLGGESGVGKTRLIQEVTRKVAQTKNTCVLLGECEDVPLKKPLSAFQKTLQALSDRCRIHGLKETERLLGPRGPVLALYQPSLRRLPGQEDYPAPIKLPVKDAQLRLFSFFQESLCAYTEENPLFFVLDDLQWADNFSLDFLAFLLSGNPFPKGLWVLGTYRGEEQTEGLRSLLSHSKVESLEVGRLEETAVEQMVGDMLSLIPPPKKFSRFLARQSEGNPFFVTEYIHTAVKEGIFWRDSVGKWQLANTGEAETSYEQIGLPSSLKALVDRWLQGLSPSARKWMEAAAVLGRESSLDVLEQMGPKDMSGLNELLVRQVLEEPVIGKVRFVHDQLREGVFLQIQTKHLLHRKAAEGLQKVLGEEGLEGILGYHWEQAKEPEKAKPYYLVGAKRALTIYNYDEAEKLYRSYLNLVFFPSEESITARHELGEKVLLVQGKVEEAKNEYETALKEAQKVTLFSMEALSLHLLGEVYWRIGQLEKAQHFEEQSLNLAKQLKDTQLEWSALNGLAVISHEQNRLTKAQNLYKEALYLAQQMGERQNEAICLSNLGIFFFEQGFWEKAKSLYEEALYLARQLEDLQIEGLVLNSLAALHQDQGFLKKAKSLYEEALRLARQLGDLRREGTYLGNVAVLSQEQGAFKEARDQFEQAILIQREIGNRRTEGIFLGGWASLERLLGNLSQASIFCEKAETLLQEVGDLLELGKILCEQGHLALAKEESAKAFLQQGSEIAEKLDIKQETMLTKKLAKLERAQELVEKKELIGLFRGERREDIPLLIQESLLRAGQLDKITLAPKKS